MTTTTNKTNEAFAKALKRANGTIIDVARDLDITIAKASELAFDVSLVSEKAKKIMAEREWPLCVDSGYIYIGPTRPIYDGSEKELKHGQLVFVEQSHTNNRLVICKAVPIIQAEVELFTKKWDINDRHKPPEEKLVRTIWQPLKDQLPFRVFKSLEQVKKDHGCPIHNTTGRVRTVYLSGAWLGWAFKSDLKSVTKKVARF